MAEKKNVNVVLLLGSFFKRKATLERIRSLLKDAEEYICEGEETFEYLQMQVMSQSCFSEKRLIIIREQPTYACTRPTFLKNFRAMLTKVPEDCTLVIDNAPNLADLLIKDVEKIGKVFDFEQYLPKNEACKWVCDRYNEQKRPIDYQWATMMVESLSVVEKKGVDIDCLTLLCEKLDAYLGSRTTIKEDDVRTVCVDESDFIVWSLLGRLDSKDVVAAMQEVNRAIDREGDARGVVERILYQMHWKFRTLWFEKEGISKGWSQDQLLSAAKMIHKFERKEKPDGKKTEKFEVILKPQLSADGQPKPFWSDNALIANLQGFYGSKPSLACYTRMELYKAMDAISDTMTRVREGAGEEEIRLLVDFLIMSICGHESAEQISRWRKPEDVRVH